VVGDVGGEVDREADAHDEHDHADDVDVDVGQGHEADDAHLDRDDGEDDPDDAHLVGDEDQGDDGHAGHAAAMTILQVNFSMNNYGLRIRDPEKNYSGSRILRPKKGRIPDPDPQHW
jgi:hypothetical protein